MSTAAHRSIGEVLALLKDEFPDITISKIRFLESQGLLDPERTPSGYRRFYDKDVDRLRWILRQQREHFLPLKVIKGRLAENDDISVDLLDHPNASAGEGPEPSGAVEEAEGAADANGAMRRPASERLASTPPASASTRAAEAKVATEPEPPRRVLPEPALFTHRLAAEVSPVPGPRGSGDTAVSLTSEELAAAAGLSSASLADLERFGLIEHRAIGSTVVYDEDALLVARLAAAFLAHGVEPRHLRMYKVAADREAGMLEQVVLPLARHRAPDARRKVTDTLGELARLGAGVHAAMLLRALRNLT
jgi:DNA-binding transcriptional MerR regulator